MNLYWLSRNGAAAEGPFAEDQLLQMWRSGGVGARDQVCIEGEEEWTLVKELIEAIQSAKREFAREKAQRAKAVAAMQAARVPEKSATAAVVMSLFLPGAGHLYAGEIWQGLALLGMCVGGWVAGVVWLALVLWAVGLVDSAGAVRRFNARR